MKQLIRIALIATVVVGGTFFLTACTLPGSGGSTSVNQQPTATAQPAAGQKSGTTSKTGLLSTAGGKFFITVTGQPPAEIDSYGVDLSAYVGQSVTVTGQYSGDTLFVSEVK
jgi:hypothetical protein